MATVKFYGVGPQEQFSFEVDQPPFGPGVKLFASLEEAQAEADASGQTLQVLDAMDETQRDLILSTHAEYVANWH